MFSQASEYALRALTELARCEKGEWVLAGDMAELLDVPVHYLAKVLQTLARKGIQAARRGNTSEKVFNKLPQDIFTVTG